MLTKEHAIARYDFQRQRILPDRLTSGGHAQYLQFAERMLDVYRTGSGRRRRDLHRDVHRIFEDEVDCPLRRIDGFCKLLDDQSTYADAGRRRAPELRRQVFRIAARHHPLVDQADNLFEHCAEDVKALIAKELQRDWEFDSSIEADFAEKWGDEVRDGWTLEREAEVLHSGQKTFVPDFALRHNDGRTVLMEIIGFWTPEYIEARLKTLDVFRDTPILLTIHESTSHHFAKSAAAALIVTYKTVLLLKPVLEALAKY